MCGFTWLVQTVTWPEQFISCLHLEKMMAASKLQNKRLVKYVNKDMTDFWYTISLGCLELLYEFTYIQFCWVWS